MNVLIVIHFYFYLFPRISHLTGNFSCFHSIPLISPASRSVAVESNRVRIASATLISFFFPSLLLRELFSQAAHVFPALHLFPSRVPLCAITLSSSFPSFSRIKMPGARSSSLQGISLKPSVQSHTTIHFHWNHKNRQQCPHFAQRITVTEINNSERYFEEGRKRNSCRRNGNRKNWAVFS